MEWLQEYYFLHVGTLWDESKHILFSSDEYSNVAKLLFSTWWNIAWCIKTNFLSKYCMQWLHEYYFLHVGIFCDTSKWHFFLSIVCSDCKNSVFFMLGHFVMHQNSDASKRIFFWSNVCNDCKNIIFHMFGPSLMI